MPERDASGFPRRRGDHDLRRGDVGHPPPCGAEDEDFAGSHFVDHLLVELANLLAVIQQVHGEQSAVGDGATAHDRQSLCPRARTDLPLQPVPDDAWAQLGELVGRIATAQHVERRLQRPRSEVAERIGTMHQLRQRGHAPLLHGRHRDDLLGEHVERVARHPRRLDLASQHAIDNHRRLEEVAAVLREDRALRRLAHRVAGPSDSLDAAGDARGRLHLDHEIDRAHVDAELEARSRHKSGQSAGLEGIFDEKALLLGNRAVMCSD